MSKRHGSAYAPNKKEICMGCGAMCKTAFCDGCAPPVYRWDENIDIITGPNQSTRRNGMPLDLRLWAPVPNRE